jgi:ketosteroid isomerase-like protein
MRNPPTRKAVRDHRKTRTHAYIDGLTKVVSALALAAVGVVTWIWQARSGKVYHAVEARAEVEAQYERLAKAIRRKDVQAILALQAPDFSSNNVGGAVFDRAAMEAYTRRLMSAVDSVIYTRNRIREFTLRGDTAVADVCQEFSRIQRVDGAPHRVDTSVLQTETWVRLPDGGHRLPDGWRRRRVDNERGMRWFVDGRRTDPVRPSLGGPEYRPDPDPPTGCGLR